jgi:hypothetical protein
MYIKLKNNEIEKYPYNIGQLYVDNPDTSFPSSLPDSLLEEYEVYEVVSVEQPSITHKQNLVEGTPVNEDGVWKQVWNITDKPIDEVSAIQESNRKQAYIEESDPIFFKWQRGEATKQEWLDKIADILQRFPK